MLFTSAMMICFVFVLYLMHLMLTENKQLKCQFIEVRISPLPPQLAFFSMAVRSCSSEVLGPDCAWRLIDERLCWVQSLLDPVCWPDCICGHLLRGVFMIEKGKLGNGSCFIIQPWDHLFLVTCVSSSHCMCVLLHHENWNHMHEIDYMGIWLLSVCVNYNFIPSLFSFPNTLGHQREPFHEYWVPLVVVNPYVMTSIPGTINSMICLC